MSANPFAAFLKDGFLCGKKGTTVLAMLQEGWIPDISALKVSTAKIPDECANAIKILLHYGACPLIKNKEGNNCFDFASKNSGLAQLLSRELAKEQKNNLFSNVLPDNQTNISNLSFNDL